MVFANYFNSIYLQDNDKSVHNDILNNMPNIDIHSFTEEDIKRSISQLKNKMTAGHDQIPSFLVKDCSGVFIKPLTFLFNLALRTSVFPDCWKLARVCPVLKSGDISDITNYRPITILPNFSKVFEISLYNRIYPSVNKSLSIYQHGFMEKRSTVTNLALITQDISETIDAQGQVDVVYTDFSKAFDTISHTIIILKLMDFGLSSNLINLFTSYLNNRVQYVAYNGFRSDVYTATSGVPQGSNLGPLLFLLFIDDLTKSIDCHKLLFADDLKIYFDINNINDCIFLQSQINSLEEWCNTFKLKLNESKCKVISYSRKKEPIIYKYQLNNQILNREYSTKDLGILFDNKLHFSEHISNLGATCSKTLGFIIRNCKSFNNELALKTLYYSLVRSKLEYGSLIWYPLYENHSMILESVQRKFLKFLAFRNDGVYPGRGYNHEILLSRFDVPSLQSRRIMNSVTFLYNLLHNKIDCSSLLELINFRVPQFNARQNNTFYIPNARTNVLKKSPIYVMCQNFNNISNQSDINFDSITSIKESVHRHFQH